MEKEVLCVVAEGNVVGNVVVGMIEGRVLVRERPERDFVRPRVDVLGGSGERGCESRDRDADAKVRALCWCRWLERALILALKLSVREGIESKMHLTTRPQRRHMVGSCVGDG